MSNSSRKAFGKRLSQEMTEQGYTAPRSALGADPKPLKEAAGVRSLESARKWLSGQSMPKPEIQDKIALWLGVMTPWLRDGTEPKYRQQGANEPAANYSTISPDAQSIATRFDALPPALRGMVEQQLQQAESFATACSAITLGKYKDHQIAAAVKEAQQIIQSGALDEFTEAKPKPGTTKKTTKRHA